MFAILKVWFCMFLTYKSMTRNVFFFNLIENVSIKIVNFIYIFEIWTEVEAKKICLYTIQQNSYCWIIFVSKNIYGDFVSFSMATFVF